MIRDATKEDIPKLLELGKKFFKATEYASFMPFSEENTINIINELIDGDSGILLVLDNNGVSGMIGGLVYPFYMSKDLTGQELFWWCEDKGKGLGLLDAIEKQAKEKGAKTFNMMSLDKLTPERLDKIYLSKGYTRSEHTYIRRL